jgi:hypothetical protein
MVEYGGAPAEQSRYKVFTFDFIIKKIIDFSEDKAE